MILNSVWRHLAPWHAENMHIFFHVILNENADIRAYVCVYVFGMGGPSASTVQFSLLYTVGLYVLYRQLCLWPQKSTAREPDQVA